MGTSYARGRILASLAALWLAGCVAPVNQQIGVMVGDPTGASYKGDLPSGDAVAVGVGIGFIDGGGFHGHVDYIRALSRSTPEAIFYGGLGVRLRLRDGDPNSKKRDDTDFGPRVPLGVLFEFRDPDLHLFIEIAPGIDLIHPKATVDLALGLRVPF